MFTKFFKVPVPIQFKDKILMLLPLKKIPVPLKQFLQNLPLQKVILKNRHICNYFLSEHTTTESLIFFFSFLFSPRLIKNNPGSPWGGAIVTGG